MKLKIRFILFAMIFPLLINVSQAKTLKISTNPISLLFGIVPVAVDLGLSKHLAIGASAAFIDADDLQVKQKGEAYTGRVSIFFSEVFDDSWYLRGEYGTIDTDITVSSILGGAEVTGTAKGSFYGGLLGYHWLWDFFTFEIGLGYGIYDVEIKMNDGSSVTNLPLDGGTVYGDISFGIAF